MYFGIMHIYINPKDQGDSEGAIMAVSYKKLWKLLIDRDMMKKDLAAAADISNYTISKMSKGENVTVEILGKICKALNCKIDDIMEFIPDKED